MEREVVYHNRPQCWVAHHTQPGGGRRPTFGPLALPFPIRQRDYGLPAGLWKHVIINIIIIIITILIMIMIMIMIIIIMIIIIIIIIIMDCLWDRHWTMCNCLPRLVAGKGRRLKVTLSTNRTDKLRHKLQ